MKICLATIHAYRHSLPLALMYIKANLVERHGYACDMVAIEELPPEESTAHHAAQILAGAPDVVGLSCYIWNGRALLDVARELRTQRPDIRIVLGGPEVGPVARDVLTAEPYADVVVRGEGEVAFAEIVDAWQADHDLDAVCGICFRKGDTIIETGDAIILRDLNLLPSPHNDKYVTYQGRVASIETQRGCVFRCSFCFYNKDLSIRNRRFDLDRVKGEILYWLNRDVHSIYLMDPVFNLNAERAKEICRFIAEHNHNKVRIHSEIWAEFMDDELAALMKAASFYWLEVGLQTTDDTTLQAVERRLRMKPFLEGIGHLKRHGVHFELQLIYGLPLETPETFRRSLDFAAKLEPSELSVFMLLVLPGTELWKKARAMGIEYNPDPPYTIRSHSSMSAEVIAAGEHLVEAVNFMCASQAIRILQREPGISMSLIVDAWNHWREVHGLKAMPGTQMGGFIEAFCETHGIPAQFYAAMIAREYAPGAPTSGRTAPGRMLREYPEPGPAEVQQPH